MSTFHGFQTSVRKTVHVQKNLSIATVHNFNLPHFQVKTKTPYGVEDEEEEENKPKKEYTPQKPFATDDAMPRPSTKVRKPPGGESHIFF